MVSISTPGFKLQESLLSVPLYVDPEPLDTECPKTANLKSSDIEFELKVGEKRIVKVPEYQLRLDGICENNFTISIQADDGLPPFIRDIE